MEVLGGEGEVVWEERMWTFRVKRTRLVEVEEVGKDICKGV